MEKALYITTTLPYVNAEPHIGFAFEILHADAIARYRRAVGNRVFFSTGTDEHGQKVYEKAKAGGEDVQSYVDRHAAAFAQLKASLDLSYDAFIRTTSEPHKLAAQELWRRCFAQGDIYKKKYKGLYCVGCEKFLTEKDLVGGRCPLHPDQIPETVEEENYFFALSKYQRGLLDYLSREGVIVPEHRREEARQFVAGGLEDFSISREKGRMPWGIPVPDDDTQVMYVWFDALTNYISTLGWPDDAGHDFDTFWNQGETLQIAGKDQLRFQSIMWQAMLMSADIKPTDRVFYHGFITSGGQKMSKSLGNVINPKELVEKYGTDATRYLLLRHVHPVEDTDITWERLDEWYTAGLVNGLGNLTARVMKLSETHLKAGVRSDSLLPQGEYVAAFDALDLQAAADYIWGHVQALDKKITDTKPFSVVKANPEEGKRLIAEAVTELYTIAHLLRPLMPETSKKIQTAVVENKMPPSLFPRKE